jgi:endonuclease YncB( thermonuclease family)
MKKSLYLLVFFLAFIFVLPASSKQKPIYRGKCVGVHDGDTITVLVDGKQFKIRLEGIDAPELGQDFSQKSKQFLSGLVFGQEVTIKEDSIDRHGRTVGRVFVGYRDVSCEIISAGLAWHFKKYSSDINLARLEESARMSSTAIWSMPNPIAPWDYRAGTSSKTISQLSSTSGRIIHTGPRGGKYYINSKGKKVYVKKKK